MNQGLRYTVGDQTAAVAKCSLILKFGSAENTICVTYRLCFILGHTEALF